MEEMGSGVRQTSANSVEPFGCSGVRGWCRCGIGAALALAILAVVTPSSAGPLDAFWPHLWWVHRL